MGTYATAELFYGYTWSEEGYEGLYLEEPGEDEEDWDLDLWETRLQKQRGITSPYRVFDAEHPSGSYPPGEFKALWQTWQAEHEDLCRPYEEFRKFIRGLPCELTAFGHHEVPFPALQVKSTRISVSYGEVIEVAKSLGERTVGTHPWDVALERFADLAGLNLEKASAGPAWLVTVSYG